MEPVNRSRLRISKRARRALLFLAGSLAVALAVLGVVLPVLPTTPFALLAAYCFARSSRRAHSWLLRNRLFGRQLRDYLAGRGISVRVKAISVVFLWGTLGVSGLLFVPFLWVRLLLAIVALVVTTHIVLIKRRKGGAGAGAETEGPEPLGPRPAPDADHRDPIARLRLHLRAEWPRMLDRIPGKEEAR